jgi:hypothetical protein
MSIETLILAGHTWVAFGPAGAVGSIHPIEGGYTFRLLRDGRYRGVFPTLGVAKSALHASLLPGSEWPEFREH